MAPRLARPDTLQPRRIVLFLAVAFGASWAVGGVVYATGGLRDSPQVVPGLTLATVLLAGGYMFGPALAHVVTRAATGEGFSGARAVLRPRLRAAVRGYALAWFAPAALVAVGATLFFLLFPRHFDPALGTLRALLPADAPLSLELLFAVQVAAVVTVAPLVNAVFAFGEEFGWRAYLLPKLLPLGTRRAVLAQGVVWGVWHWPLIAMGYNYGIGYTGAPWTGFLAMCWLTVSAGTFLAWVTLRSGSVWPAAVGHGAINAVGGVPALLGTGDASALLGPTVVGAVVVVPWALLAGWLLADQTRLDARTAAADCGPLASE